MNNITLLDLVDCKPLEYSLLLEIRFRDWSTVFIDGVLCKLFITLLSH